MSKTLLLLGGARYALPVIDAAHEVGAKVITCDYLPNNFAHAYSDGYINASIVDNEAVLAAAVPVEEVNLEEAAPAAENLPVVKVQNNV